MASLHLETDEAIRLFLFCSSDRGSLGFFCLGLYLPKQSRFLWSVSSELERVPWIWEFDRFSGIWEVGRVTGIWELVSVLGIRGPEPRIWEFGKVPGTWGVWRLTGIWLAGRAPGIRELGNGPGIWDLGRRPVIWEDLAWPVAAESTSGGLEGEKGEQNGIWAWRVVWYGQTFLWVLMTLL